MSASRSGPLTRSDLFLPSSDWGSLVVGRTSQTIDVDSNISHIRENSEARLLQELRYASHLGLPAVMVTLTSPVHTNLARVVSNYIIKGASFQMWVRVPFCPPALDKFEDVGSKNNEEQTWDWWNTFRLVADSSSKINLCLEMTEKVPQDIEIQRWLGEPVKTVRYYANHCIFMNELFLALNRHLSVPNQQKRLPSIEQTSPEPCQEVHQPRHTDHHQRSRQRP